MNFKNTVLILLIGFIAYSCNVEKEEKGELPEVDVDVATEAGELPEYDIDWANVDVGTRTRTVEIPKVVIVTEEEEVEVPYVDVNMPNEESQERTLMVEAEVSGNEHDIEIQEIRADKRTLYVIATLNEGEQDLGGKTMRVQDQVDINAPADLNVKHIIVGTKQDRAFNKQYTYVSSMDDLADNVKNAKTIYSES